MLIKNFGYKIWQAVVTSYGYTKALVDDSIKGVLRSIGDAGDTPTNATGKTLLKLNTDILAKQETQLRDFYIDTQTETIAVDSVYYIASGSEWAVKDKLTVEGKIVVSGKLIIV